MRTSGAGALLGSCALLLVACSGNGDGATTGRTVGTTGAPPGSSAATSTTAGSSSTSTSAPDRAASLERWQCPGGSPADAACYRIDMPADWSQPDGATVSLPVAVLPATGTARQPDAIVAPAGGPGFNGLSDADYYSTSPLRVARDIVLYDQRGTGRAEPALECPERDAAWKANLQRDAPFAVERAAIVEGLAACRRRLEAAGIDLGDYDTEASVRDLDAIRAALGYDRWNLLGVSYGARLSLAAMRSTPEHLRSVILDSVYDVTGGGLAAQAASAERAFAALADGCVADPTCHAAHPDVAATINAIRDRYNATPIEVDVDLEDGAGTQHWVITGDDAMAGLFNALYDASLIPALPSILDSLAAGDTGIVPALIRRGVAFATGAADGMQMSVDCADNAGLGEAADAAAIADPGRTRLIVTGALCSEWPVPATSPTFNRPVVSPVPALVLAGAYDPITPPAGTQAVAERLPQATFGLWPNRGHGVSGDPCAAEVESGFLADPAAPIDLACLAQVPGPAFT
jgi:pimeloyl-ACP methyl ester carboxylesterase